MCQKSLNFRGKYHKLIKTADIAMNFGHFEVYRNRVRTAQRMLKMKDKLSETIPPKDPNKTLISTWNIRALDSKDYGARSIEALYYIAQILERFDIIAVQKVKEDLNGLERLMTRLGRDHWRYIVSDVSDGKPGNRERMAFIYDRRSVKFNSMVGEVVIPPKEIKEGNKTIKYEPSDQLYRTPYMCAFQVGWTKLIMCTVHILYGEDKANNKKRTREIALVADFLAKRSKERNDYSNLILLGYFNIYDPKDDTMKAMTDAGFLIDESLQKLPATNIGKRPDITTKSHFDQKVDYSKQLETQAFLTSLMLCFATKMRMNMCPKWVTATTPHPKGSHAQIKAYIIATIGARIKCLTICLCGFNCIQIFRTNFYVGSSISILKTRKRMKLYTKYVEISLSD